MKVKLFRPEYPETPAAPETVWVLTDRGRICGLFRTKQGAKDCFELSVKWTKVPVVWENYDYQNERVSLEKSRMGDVRVTQFNIWEA